MIVVERWARHLCTQSVDGSLGYRVGVYALHTVSGVMPSVRWLYYYLPQVYYYLPHTASRAQLRVRLREAVEGALVLEGVTVAPSA